MNVQERRCAHCGGALPPAARRHARFCSPAHRRAAHRAHNGDSRRGHARFLVGIDAKKSAAAPYVALVADELLPGMYRLKRADGTLSDMVNLTRAKDGLAAMQGRA
jgi:hypothetical protein